MRNSEEKGDAVINGFERKKFLPMSRYEMQKAGWESCHVVLLTGDAYIDHPSYGVAVVARLLESEGLRVGIIAQPNPRRQVDFTQLGRPTMFFGVTSGCADSMINNYSPTRRPRKFDNYTAGRLPGKRPDHAAVVYAKTLKGLFPETPVILGGIEASLRRLAHYDFFDNQVMMSVLSESGADLLAYGQAEKALREIVAVFRSGDGLEACRRIRGVAWRADSEEEVTGIDGEEHLALPSYEEVAGDKKSFFQMAKTDLHNSDPRFARRMIQAYPDHILVVNAPQTPMTTEELDAVYKLPFIRTPHPRYKKQGAIPAFETVKFSLMTHRGCYAGCSFCPIYAHQGRHVSSRSEEGILDEARMVTSFRYFRGVVSNVGGPVGNLYQARCKRADDPKVTEACGRASCYYPDRCRHLSAGQKAYTKLLKKVLDVEGIQRAFIASGFRYDLFETEADGRELMELILSRFTDGTLKVTPTHVSDAVSRRIRKFTPEATRRFFDNCETTLKKLGLEKMEIIPYFMASHPGSTMEDALEVAMFLEERGIKNSQIQDFVPCPGTASACMHHTGRDPMSDEPMYCPHSHRERKLQRALLQYFKPENAPLVLEALREAGRTDLIGDGPGCILEPMDS